VLSPGGSTTGEERPAAGCRVSLLSTVGADASPADSEGIPKLILVQGQPTGRQNHRWSQRRSARVEQQLLVAILHAENQENHLHHTSRIRGTRWNIKQVRL
jgi:hypothetical protein